MKNIFKTDDVSTADGVGADASVLLSQLMDRATSALARPTSSLLSSAATAGILSSEPTAKVAAPTNVFDSIGVQPSKAPLSYDAAAKIALANTQGGPLAKLDDQLAGLFYMTNPAAKSMAAYGATVGQFANAVTSDGQYVKINVLSSTGDGAATLHDLQAIGLLFGASYGALAGGVLPTSELGALMNLASVQSASEVGLIHHVGRVTSQSDHALAADAAKTTYGFDGTGLKVGVLSDSFDKDTAAVAPNPMSGGAAIRDNAAYDIVNGDLPADTTVLQDYTSGTGVEDEGRAMAQIIHDLAPGASIEFATADISEAGFANNIIALATAGAKIIVDDVSYYDEPAFQNGIVSQAVNTVAAQGVSYFSSAGNEGDGWFGTVGYHTDTATTITTTTGSGPVTRNLNETVAFATFGGKDYLPLTYIDNYASNYTATITVSWDEPDKAAGNGSPGVTTDIDFFVVDLTTGLIKKSSTANNVTSGIPNSTINFTQVAADHNYALYVGVKLAPGATTYDPANAPQHVKVVIFGLDYRLGDDTTNTARIDAGSTYGHNAAAGANTVAAAEYDQTQAYGHDPAIPEYYSSPGNVTLYYTDSGQRLATPQTLNKVDVTATDGADTSFFGYSSGNSGDYDNSGYPDFYGTSAAAPAAAAVGALMLQADATLTPDDVRHLQQDSALPVAAPGFPIAAPPSGATAATTGGAGLIQADAAVGFATGADIQNANQKTLYGTHRADTIRGSDAGVTLYGYGGADHIFGGAGADTIVGGAQGDQLSGGGGADTFLYTAHDDSLDGHNDAINDFESGIDKIDVSAVDGGYLHVSYLTGDSYIYFDDDGAGGWRQVVAVSGVVAGSDLVVSPKTILTLIGASDGESHDITGGAGEDHITAGNAGGRLDGGGGRDVYSLGAGVDRLVFDSAADSPNGTPDIVYNFTSGQDVLDVSAVIGEIDLNYGSDGKTYVFYGNQTGEIIFNGLVKPNDLATSNEPLIIEQGSSVAGTLYGGGGAGSEVRMFAGSAGDTLIASTGHEAMRGGAGADTFVFGDPTDSLTANPDVIYDFQHGSDKLDVSGGDAGQVAIVLQSSSETDVDFGGGIGLAGTGQVVVHGAITPDDLIVSAATTQIRTVIAGADLTAVGGTGVDRFDDQAGGATITGGAGGDLFVFSKIAGSPASDPSTITDFDPMSGDKIALNKIDADPSTPADDAFHLVNSFGGHAGELTISYDLLSNTTTVAGDVTGDGAADFLLHLTGLHDQTGIIL